MLVIASGVHGSRLHASAGGFEGEGSRVFADEVLEDTAYDSGDVLEVGLYDRWQDESVFSEEVSVRELVDKADPASGEVRKLLGHRLVGVVQEAAKRRELLVDAMANGPVDQRRDRGDDRSGVLRGRLGSAAARRASGRRGRLCSGCSLLLFLCLSAHG